MSGKLQRIRPAVNPLDKTTIVSIYPKKISFRNYTVFPGVFEMREGTVEKPAILVLGTSFWTYNNYEANQSIDIPSSSIEMANSFVNDYCIGLHCYTPEHAMPGLFFMPGDYTRETLKQHSEWESRKRIALDRQENWYRKLVEEADVLWSRTDGNPRAIHADMRRAAEYFQLKDKPWMANQSNMLKKACPYCGYMRLPTFPKCSNCHEIIDIEAYKNLQDFAKLGNSAEVAPVVSNSNVASRNPIIGPASAKAAETKPSEENIGNR